MCIRDQRILIQPVQSQTLCVWAMHAQHFVDNQTIHRSHRSSPFVFRSQVVYRHTDSDSPCEHTPAFSFGGVPVGGYNENSERGPAPSRKASASIPARIYI